MKRAEQLSGRPGAVQRHGQHGAPLVELHTLSQGPVDGGHRESLVVGFLEGHVVSKRGDDALAEVHNVLAYRAMDSQVANAFAQRIIDNPVSQSFFDRAVRIAFTDEPSTVVVLTFSPDRSLGLTQHYVDDPALEQVPVKFEFTPDALREAAHGRIVSEPQDVTGADEGLARQVLMVLGIQAANTQLGGGGVGQQGGSFEMSREMVLDTQLSSDRQVFSVFDARHPGPYDCRHWRIEAGVTQEGLSFAVSVGLMDPSTPLRAPHSEQRQVMGAGHELLILTGHDGASGHAHVGVLAMVLRQLADDERPFGSPDWIDYNRPLWRGGSVEGFVIMESQHLQSPYALADGYWGRFYTMIGLTRDELDLLNTQKEPRRVLSILRDVHGNIEVTDPWRDPVNLW